MHHRDPVGDEAHERQVVRDEDVGEAQPFLQRHQHLDHLRLHGDVERRDRLVEDEDLRLERQRARDGDPLPLTARKLVRVEIGELRAAGSPGPEAPRSAPACAARSTTSGWISHGSEISRATLRRGCSEA